jgi:hypothetical protein
MQNTRQLSVLLYVAIAIVGLRIAFASQLDRRFEGIWVGVETFQVPANFMQWGEAPSQKPVVIAIGDSGRIIAVAQGFGFGRYQVQGNSSGNTLLFKQFGGASLSEGRLGGGLTLSPDGNTITEKGEAFLLAGGPHPVMCHITATLHRQGKK